MHRLMLYILYFSHDIIERSYLLHVTRENYISVLFTHILLVVHNVHKIAAFILIVFCCEIINCIFMSIFPSLKLPRYEFDLNKI